MKSGAGEDGWCEVMNRGEFSSVWVIMGGEMEGKQPSCVNNEGATTRQSVNDQVRATYKWTGKFQNALTFRKVGVMQRAKDR